MSPRVMPAQKPGKSEQAVGTPREFIQAVVDRFGGITWDLAANAKNCVVDRWFGPGSSDGEDALEQDWFSISNFTASRHPILWLNPPFGHIGRWAAKCSLEMAFGARIAFLVPASVGSEWYRQCVASRARVFALSPRIKFIGHKSPYPKDLILAVYDRAFGPSFGTWRWKP